MFIFRARMASILFMNNPPMITREGENANGSMKMVYPHGVDNWHYSIANTLFVVRDKRIQPGSRTIIRVNPPSGGLSIIDAMNGSFVSRIPGIIINTLYAAAGQHDRGFGFFNVLQFFH